MLSYYIYVILLNKVFVYCNAILMSFVISLFSVFSVTDRFSVSGILVLFNIVHMLTTSRTAS